MLFIRLYNESRESMDREEYGPFRKINIEVAILKGDDRAIAIRDEHDFWTTRGGGSIAHRFKTIEIMEGGREKQNDDDGDPNQIKAAHL